jgi:Peptidase A4 family
MKWARLQRVVLGGALAASSLLTIPTAMAAPLTHSVRMAVNAGHARIGAGRTRSTWAASNWSGYAETGTFTGISGTWIVPQVSPTTSATYSSAWIGVDGFSNSDLIQTGTEQDYYNGSAHYDAWWEILPAAETALSFRSYPVSPGDHLSAHIWETTTTLSTGRTRQHGIEHVWQIAIADTTKGWDFQTGQAYNGPGTSAEWILEAPSVGGVAATLNPYTINAPAGAGDFDNAGTLSTIGTSRMPPYKNAALNYQNNAGAMIQKYVEVSTPGNPDRTLNAFDVKYGANMPATPTS